MLEKIREYFEEEYNDTKRLIDNDSPIIDRQNCSWYAMQRCLGVMRFVQTVGISSFAEVEPLFEEYRKKFQQLS